MLMHRTRLDEAKKVVLKEAITPLGPNSQPPMRPFLETYTQEQTRNGQRGNNLDLIGSCRLVWSCLCVFNVDLVNKTRTLLTRHSPTLQPQRRVGQVVKSRSSTTPKCGSVCYTPFMGRRNIGQAATLAHAPHATR